mgnify:CR=1 FL=1
MRDKRGNTIPEVMELANITKDIQEMTNRDQSNIDDIRTWRDMYDLNWKPAEKRADIDYSVDPLPMTTVDHAVDRLTAQDPILDVPVDQFSLEENELLQDEEVVKQSFMIDTFPRMNPQMDITEMISMREAMKEGYKHLLQRKQQTYAREKSDTIEHFLLGIWEWSEREQGEFLFRRIAHDLCCDAVAVTRVTWDFEATASECPILLKRVNPVAAHWRRGPHGIVAFVATDTMNYTYEDIYREYGIDARKSLTDPWTGVAQLNDYWLEIKKTKKTELWNAILCGGKSEDSVFLKEPIKTDYTSIPYVVSAPRPYENVEDLSKRRSLLTALEVIWKQMNVTNTRWGMILKKAAFVDTLATGPGSSALDLDKMGTGQSVKQQVDSPDVKVQYIVPPDAPNSIHLYRQMLDQQAQLATFPKPIYGERAGTSSGIQDITLIQSGLVRLNAFTRALRIHLEGVFDQIQLRALEFGKNSTKLQLQTSKCCREVKLGDVKGRFKLNIRIKGETLVEELMRGLAFLQYRAGPTPLLSDDYILDKGIGVQFPGREQEKALRQAVERHKTLIDFNAEQVRAQMTQQSELQAQLQAYMLEQQAKMMPKVMELEMQKMMAQAMMQKMAQAMMGGGSPPPEGITMGGEPPPPGMQPPGMPGGMPPPEVANRLAALGMVRG